MVNVVNNNKNGTDLSGRVPLQLLPSTLSHYPMLPHARDTTAKHVIRPYPNIGSVLGTYLEVIMGSPVRHSGATVVRTDHHKVYQLKRPFSFYRLVSRCGLSQVSPPPDHNLFDLLTQLLRKYSGFVSRLQLYQPIKVIRRQRMQYTTKGPSLSSPNPHLE